MVKQSCKKPKRFINDVERYCRLTGTHSLTTYVFIFKHANILCVNIFTEL